MKPPASESPATNPATGPHHRHHHHAKAAHPAPFQQHVDHAAVTAALRTAITKEAVPQTWEPGLNYIMQHESGGRVGVANGVDTARGLFQLTAASYHLNPHGAASFGNATEEAQGGIRYIQQRYQSADNAVSFWQRHGWY